MDRLELVVGVRKNAETVCMSRSSAMSILLITNAPAGNGCPLPANTERDGIRDFFLAVVAASMILKGLSVKTVGHLGYFMAASNKTNELSCILSRGRHPGLAVSMILNGLILVTWPSRTCL